ncbi:MAG TPA: P-type conjugative transfer protein TrbL [Vicinamibacterales bacterium]|nr:P-type conjugative transfer protein TrbL [Vicinamibacterales bacterium]
MTPDTGTLTHLLDAFLTVFNGGWGALQPKAMSLLGILVGIELTLSGLWWAMSGDDAVKGLIQKLLLIGVFFFFIQQWQMVTTTTMQSFARAGAAAGGASTSPGSLALNDPSSIVAEGLNAIQPLSDKVDELTSGTWTALKNLGTIMQIGLAMIGILFSFFLLGIQCFLVYLEFYIVAILSLILLPCGVFRHTSFLAEKAFGAVLAHGIKLMVLAFVIAIAQPVLQQITVPADFSMRDAWCTLLAAMTICFLAWHAPGVAAGLLAGSPSLSAGHATGAALETGGAVVLGAAGIAAAGRAAASGVGATVQAASALKTGAGAGAARAAEAGAGPVGQAAGAVGGAAKVALSPLARMAETMKKRVSDGQLAGFAAHGIAPMQESAKRASASANPSSPAAGGDAASPPGSPSPSAASSSSTASPSGSTSTAPRTNDTAPAQDSAAASEAAAVRPAADAADVARMAGDAPASRAPATVHTLNAARIAPGQRRTDDAATVGMRPNLSASLHRDATARDGATQATEQAAKAARLEDEPPTDEVSEPALKVAEPRPPEAPADTTNKE